MNVHRSHIGSMIERLMMLLQSSETEMRPLQSAHCSTSPVLTELADIQMQLRVTE